MRQAFERSPAQWKYIYDSKTPYSEDVSAAWNVELSDFQRMTLIRVVRPDKAVPLCRIFVQSKLGTKFTEPPPFDLGQSYSDSVASAPLIFVLSPGTNLPSVI